MITRMGTEFYHGFHGFHGWGIEQEGTEETEDGRTTWLKVPGIQLTSIFRVDGPMFGLAASLLVGRSPLRGLLPEGHYPPRASLQAKTSSPTIRIYL